MYEAEARAFAMGNATRQTVLDRAPHGVEPERVEQPLVGREDRETDGHADPGARQDDGAREQARSSDGLKHAPRRVGARWRGQEHPLARADHRSDAHQCERPVDQPAHGCAKALRGAAAFQRGADRERAENHE
jgi:hypothetical protein